MLYFKNFELQSLNYFDCGICGRFEFSSSSFSRTDCVSRNSSREIATIAILQTINKVATIAVNFVRNVPTVLADVKLSCETPKPKAPPSDLCNKIMITKIIAKAMLRCLKKLKK